MTKDQTPSREEVIVWARESGLHLPYWADYEDPEKDPPRWTMVSPLPPLLERFAALVAAAERQRLHEKFMEIHKSQQHSNNYWHFAARKIKEQE